MHALLKSLLLTAALAIVTSGAAASLAAEAPGANGDRLVLAQADGPSLNEAVEQVRRQYNGRIVSAETRIRGNREVHHIKVLTEDGKVKTVRIPGRSRGS
jgi:hypothetical protein